MYFFGFFWEVVWFSSIAVLGVLHNYKTISNISVTTLGEKNASYVETPSKETYLSTTGEIVHLKKSLISYTHVADVMYILC